MPTAVLQCASFGEFVYPATVLTALAIPCRVCLASHIKHPASSRKGQSPSGSVASNSSSLKPYSRWLLLPELTMNFKAVFSAKACCEIVEVAASQSIEYRQPAYPLSSPRLLIGTRRYKYSQN